MPMARELAPQSSRAKPPPSPQVVREMHRRLRRTFGALDAPVRRDPMEELILTVLSQNTSDVNRDRAFEAMRRRFPTWEDLAAADPVALTEAIKPGGLSNIKAPRILAILAEIRARQGGSLDLSWLKATDDQRI